MDPGRQDDRATQELDTGRLNNGSTSGPNPPSLSGSLDDGEAGLAGFPCNF